VHKEDQIQGCVVCAQVAKQPPLGEQDSGGGLNVQFGALGCSVKTQNGETQAIASQDGNLYRLRCKAVHRIESA
jgi:hypothetical protein